MAVAFAERLVGLISWLVLVDGGFSVWLDDLYCVH